MPKFCLISPIPSQKAGRELNYSERLELAYLDRMHVALNKIKRQLLQSNLSSKEKKMELLLALKELNEADRTVVLEKLNGLDKR